MDFVLKINLDDDDLKKHPEDGTCDILKRVACDIEAGRVYGFLMDINGNKVGAWEFTDI